MNDKEFVRVLLAIFMEIKMEFVFVSIENLLLRPVYESKYIETKESSPEIQIVLSDAIISYGVECGYLEWIVKRQFNMPGCGKQRYKLYKFTDLCKDKFGNNIKQFLEL